MMNAQPRRSEAFEPYHAGTAIAETFWMASATAEESILR